MQKLTHKTLLNKIVLILLCMKSGFVFSQEIKPADKQYLINKTFSDSKYNPRQVSFLFTKSKNVFIRYNPVSLFFGSAMYVYQKVLSQQMGSACPYQISCSQFSKLSIQKYGLIKGIALSADRLTRCSQFAVYDISPLQINEKNQIIDSLETYKNPRHKH